MFVSETMKKESLKKLIKEIIKEVDPRASPYPFSGH